MNLSQITETLKRIYDEEKHHYLARRKKIFNSQDRLNRLKKWVHKEDKENDLDIKMLAVLTRAEQPGVFDILMKLSGEMCTETECDITTFLPSLASCSPNFKPASILIL